MDLELNKDEIKPNIENNLVNFCVKPENLEYNQTYDIEFYIPNVTEIDDEFTYSIKPYIELHLTDNTVKTLQAKINDEYNEDIEEYETKIIIENVTITENIEKIVFNGKIYRTEEFENIIEKTYSTQYIGDSQTLKELNQKRFQIIGYQNTVDFQTYINSIIELPFSIDSDYYKYIKLGTFQTDILCKFTDNLTVEKYFNPILVYGRYNNTLDYDSKIELTLGYYGKVQIDSKYINSVISITLKTDIATGDSVYFIYSNNELITQVKCNIAKVINFTNEVRGYREYNNQLLNEDTYIEVSYNPILENYPIYDTHKIDYLKNEKGYFEIQSVFNEKSNIPIEDKKAIIQLLQNGVYI